MLLKCDSTINNKKKNDGDIKCTFFFSPVGRMLAAVETIELAIAKKERNRAKSLLELSKSFIKGDEFSLELSKSIFKASKLSV